MPGQHAATPIGALVAASPESAPPGVGAGSRRDLRLTFLLGLLCLFVYNANFRLVAAADTCPARYLPFAILHHGSLVFDPILDAALEGRAVQPWVVTSPSGHKVSMYPVVLPILATPLYIPAAVFLHVKGWDLQRFERVARIMEKLTASLVASITAALMYRLLRRRVDRPGALLLTAAFAFGTTTWMIGSQAMWQHGLAELLIVGALLLLTGPCTTRRGLAAGALCALIVANRPPDVILAAALGIYALHWAGRRRALLVAAGGALPLALLLAYNLGVVGNFGGGYLRIASRAAQASGAMGGAAQFAAAVGKFSRHAFASGLAGLLLSPARGLFVFSPFLLFLPFGFRRALAPPGGDGRLTLYLALAVTVQMVLYAKGDWRAGFSWGPRWLTDVLPLLVWMLGPVVAGLRGAGRTAFAALTAVAIAIEVVGAFWYTGASEAAIYASPPGAADMSGVWPLANAPFVAELRHPRAPADLAVNVRGGVDLPPQAPGQGATAVPPGPLQVAGWALAGNAAPAEVVVGLDDTFLVATRDFGARPGPPAARRDTAPAPWKVVLAPPLLTGGEHLLQAWARAGEGSSLLPLAQRRIVVSPTPTAAAAATPTSAASPTSPPSSAPPAPPQAASPPGATQPALAAPPRATDLAAAAGIAAATLRAHQQREGFWLAAYTRVPIFGGARREMNTFLTAMIADLLAPVAEAGGLLDNLRQARGYLTSQIEESGLVRYHGRPDGPHIGTLGCVITPDADDTALVWRIAPGTGATAALLPRALGTLAQYRTPQGLYRTWLAPREQYRCLDPGSDPDPADVGIQMHVYLLLAGADPPAARELCGALRRAVDDERIWVYYKVAPLVPLLRQVDLRRAGCAIDLPPAHREAAVPGQEIWAAAVHQLAAQEQGAGATPTPLATAATRSLLASLAENDFALLRQTPPLLYHNDFTGSLPRFYWSEDFGYALWLRLYLETKG